MGDYRYYVLYKPYGYLSQFRKEIPSHKTLADLFDERKEVYPVGRLDKKTEGLLLLSSDPRINQALLHPKNNHSKSYYAQLEGEIDTQALSSLAKGVSIKVGKSRHKCKECEVQKIPPPPLPKRTPGIRKRKNKPTSWIDISLTEGKNRQIRKMCAVVGYPVLRLFRHRIEDLALLEYGLEPGQYLEMQGKKELFKLLKLHNL